MIYGDYHEYEKEIERFSSVISADLQRVANSYFNDENLMVMHITPEDLTFGKKLLMRIASIFVGG
jgi:predicted Zn-dependent peptidase